MKRSVLTFTVIITLILTLGITEFRADRGITVEDITIETNGRMLSGLFAIPEGRHQEGTLPGVVVFHGFTASKEMMKPIIEGLAREGFAVLAIDQQGHGQSSGDVGASLLIMST